MKTFFKLMVLASVPMALSACEVRSTISPLPGSPDDPVIDFSGNPPVTPSQLAGTWSSNYCQSASDGQTSYTLSYEYTLAGQLAVVGPMYSGAYCEGSPLAYMQFTGNYALGGMDSYVPGTTDISYAMSGTMSLRPASDYAASSFSSTAFCGMTTWQSGAPVYLQINATCLGGVNLPPGQTLIGIAGNTLYSGTYDNTGIDPNSGLQYVSALAGDVR